MEIDNVQVLKFILTFSYDIQLPEHIIEITK